jgi:transcriptional regulator of acetoin/glycerol metabolism
VTSSQVVDHVRHVLSVVTGGPRQPQTVVSRSWLRCFNEFGLDPRGPTDLAPVPPGDLRERSERLSQVLVGAKLEMSNLFQQLADAHTLVVLTDADGVILNVVGDPHFLKDAAREGLRTGAIWSERRQGTNGMGTCLMEKCPVIIHRDQHFLANNIELTCTAAPIFDSQGELTAVLDVSSRSQLLQQHSMVLVGMSAQMIENRTLLARYRNDFIIRFHSRPEFVYTLNEGMLALSGEGKVLAANRNALFQLGFPSFDAVLGRDVETVFNATACDLVGRSTSASFHPVPVYGARQGSRFFAVAQAPQRPRLAPAGRERRAAEQPGDGAGAVDFRNLEFGDPQMADNVRRAGRVLNRDISILLCGETGTGKDAFARAIHAASARSGGAFVAVNCASLPESLIESELFGYRSGAFTGASREGRRGKICQANGGTLFLDEIGDMPLALQARLLHVLESREVVPLGGEAPVQVDIQLVSASHRDLQALVQQGEFREDLFYRLQGIRLVLPPLRERADRGRLIQHVLAQEVGDGPPVTIDAQAQALFERYAWPGNIRQLRNVLRTALALCDGSVITTRELPPEILRGADLAPAAPAPPQKADGALNALESAERDALIQELERHRWNISSLAHRLGTSRNTVYRKMRRLGIPSGPASRDVP